MKSDPYLQNVRALASEAARIKGWVGSDPAHAGDLADALNAVTRARLLGRLHSEAATDAQEAVVLAARALAQSGPLGPYTAPADAGRLFAATVHLAYIQAVANLPDAAGRTLATADALRAEVSFEVEPVAAVFALLARARSLMSTGDLADANAAVDAAVAWVASLPFDVDSYLPMDAYRLAAECRWAAGLATDAVWHSLVAVERYGDVALDRLFSPGRLNEGLLGRLTEPAFAVYSEAADRLLAAGEVAAGLTKRRELAGLLDTLVERGDEVVGAQLVQVHADLAADLERVGRADEASVLRADLGGGASARAAASLPQVHGVSWQPLTAAESFGGVETRPVAAALQTAEARLAATRAAAEAAEAHYRTTALAEAAERALRQQQADELEQRRLAAQQARDDQQRAEQEAAERRAAEQREAAEVAARIAAKRARSERKQAYAEDAERREIERLAAQRADAKRRTEE